MSYIGSAMKFVDSLLSYKDFMSMIPCSGLLDILKGRVDELSEISKENKVTTPFKIILVSLSTINDSISLIMIVTGVQMMYSNEYCMSGELGSFLVFLYLIANTISTAVSICKILVYSMSCMEESKEENKDKTAAELEESLKSGIVTLFTFANCAFFMPMMPVIFLSVVLTTQIPDLKFLTVTNGKECLDMAVDTYGDGDCVNDDGSVKSDGSGSCDFYDQALNNDGMCCLICSAQEGDIIENCTMISVGRSVSCTLLALVFIVLSRFIIGSLLYNKLGKDYKFCGSCCDCCNIQGICQFFKILILAPFGIPRLIIMKINEGKMTEAKEIVETTNEMVNDAVS
jgi:hypothetical protein